MKKNTSRKDNEEGSFCRKEDWGKKENSAKRKKMNQNVSKGKRMLEI